LVQHLAAVQPGHQDVQDEQVGVARDDLLQSLFAVGGNRHCEARPAEERGQVVSDGGFVVDQKDGGFGLHG
jgi:hypothetical protein